MAAGIVDVTRRGGILLEMLLSIALLAGAAAFVLSAMRNSSASMVQASMRQSAMDEARSIISRLEAGLINANDLREGSTTTKGEGPTSARVKTSPSEFRGLTLVEIDMVDRDAPEKVVARLRQLVRLRAGRAEESPTEER